MVFISCKRQQMSFALVTGVKRCALPIAAAIRLMESRLDSPLTTAAIARRLEISVRTLELLFRQALDIGPGTYYLRLRLQAARRLLLDTQLSMQAVAVRCGFGRSEEHTSELQSLMRISYAVFCLKKKKT